MVLQRLNIWHGKPLYGDYRDGLSSQAQLPLTSTLITGDELKKHLRAMVSSYDCGGKTERDYLDAWPVYLKNYLSFYLLSLYPYSLFLDADVMITDPKLFMSHIGHEGPAMEKRARIFCPGIIYNSNDLETWKDILKIWLPQSIQSMQGAVALIAQNKKFREIKEGFKHTMAGMKKAYR